MAATATRTVHTGMGTWQNTPDQLASDEIAALADAYGVRLHNLCAAQVRLYAALLWTDVEGAESAALDVRQAVNALPPMPDWPDTDEELVARLKDRFAPRPLRRQAPRHRRVPVSARCGATSASHGSQHGLQRQ